MHRVGDVDGTLICQAPEIAAHAKAMRQKLAARLGVEHEQVGVEVAMARRLDFSGYGNGIAACAVNP